MNNWISDLRRVSAISLIYYTLNDIYGYCERVWYHKKDARFH